MINKRRLYDRLNQLGKIGRVGQGGVTRLSFTKEERQAKDLLILYMKEAGLSVREDSAGNLIGRKEGIMENAPVVLTGSHYDTVPDGGIFDGSLGVLAAIEALQCMNEQDIKTVHPIEVIAFTDEEGTRFGFGMLGSRAITGNLKKEDLRYTDQQGITIAQAMVQAGLDPENIYDAARAPETIKAYVELHIEQGKILENYNLPVGIVSGIVGLAWLKFTLKGEAGHAGATPMNMRKDPVSSAVKIIDYIENETKRYKDAVATIGKISVQPGGVNVIPGQVEFTLDLRDIDEAIRNKIEGNIISYAHQICDKSGIKLYIDELGKVAPAPCSIEIRRIIEAVCEKNGFSEFSLASGAGHDGMQFKDYCPFGMIFVRSKNGVSHSPDEWSSEDDCGYGAALLYHTLLQLAE